jgi:prepilin peptidase CpaA
MSPWLWLVPLLLVAVAAWHDLRTREIPDWISLALLGWGAVVAVAAWTGAAWLALLLGAVLGFALTAPLFWLDAIGGGDVKLVAALGAVLGPWWLLVALFWIAVAGGGFALAAKLRGEKDFAYVPAILLGLIACVVQQVW